MRSLCGPASTSGRQACARPHFRTGRQNGRGAQQCRGFMDNVAKIGKQVQGGLPIVGLLSRLTSPEGGFDDQSYPEFCRAALNAGDTRLTTAIADLETKYGRQAGRRPALLFLWMVRKGCGVLPDNYFVLSSRRLNASMDLEAEMGRFEMALDLELDKYRRMEPPVAPPPRQAVVAIDCLATCCCGLRDQVQIPQDDQKSLLDIAAVMFPDVPEDSLREAIANRSGAERKYER